VKPAIHHPIQDEKPIDEGCLIIESWNSESDESVSIARACVKSGVTTKLHMLKDVDERYLIIEGSGIMHVGDLEPTEVIHGDVVIIPAGTLQKISNTGKTDLVFYCICTPRFTDQCYQASAQLSKGVPNMTMLKDVVLGEIAGKNTAIHAYDGIIWKVRTGFLTLVFAGWAILLQSMAGGTVTKGNADVLVISMFLVSLTMTFGGWFIDRNYVQRKFRVILALNELMEEVHEFHSELGGISVDLLKVAGDDAKRKFDCSGYRQALYTGMVVFFAPPIPFAVVVCLIWNWLKLQGNS
jgi:mannose-6-phosphate isomerase-like protein (cupin superfamily)